MQVLSDNAADTTQTVTIYGTTNGTDTVVTESVSLNGTGPVVTTKTDWGEIIGVEMDETAVGTVTVREASGSLTIRSIVPSSLSSGVASVATAYQRAFDRAPTIEADGATTKKVGAVGTDTSGAVLSDNAVALNGTTTVVFPRAMNTVTKVLVGDLESARQVTVRAGTLTRTDAEVLAVIDANDAYINAVLEDRYGDAIPFLPVPALIAVISCDLSASELLEETALLVYPLDAAEATQKDALAKRLRTRAEDRLKQLVAGDLRLGLTGEESDLPRSSTYDVETDETVETVFTRGDARSWRLPEEMTDGADDVQSGA